VYVIGVGDHETVANRAVNNTILPYFVKSTVVSFAILNTEIAILFVLCKCKTKYNSHY